MNKLLNFEWIFSSIDTSWKNKTPIISTGTFRMVVNLSKTFVQTQSFNTVWNQKQIIFILGRTASRIGSCLSSKYLAKDLPRIQKLYQITYILCNALWSLFIQSFDTNLLALRGAFGLQCICRAHLITQTTHLHCRLLCNYVTILLAYCRGKLRINSCICCIKV